MIKFAKIYPKPLKHRILTTLRYFIHRIQRSYIGLTIWREITDTLPRYEPRGF